MRYEHASWSTRVGTCLPGARALMAYTARLGFGDLGCYNDRAVRGTTATPSLHREGRAVDLTVGGLDAGWLTALCDALVAHHEPLGVQMVIWQRRSWRCDRRPQRWVTYTGTDPHESHAHVELTWAAAQNLTVDYIAAVLAPPLPPELEELLMAEGPFQLMSGDVGNLFVPGMRNVPITGLGAVHKALRDSEVAPVAGDVPGLELIEFANRWDRAVT